MMAPKNEFPVFYKGILFPENFERLVLPKAFGPYLKGKQSGKIYLRNPYRDFWHVEMVRSETGEYSFEGGWPRFAALNKLEYRDFLIFQFDGNSIFDFIIYGNNMDEEEYARFKEVKPDPDEVELPKHQPRQLQQLNQPPQRRPDVVQRQEMEPQMELEKEVEGEPEPDGMEQPQQEPLQPQQQKQLLPGAVQREEVETKKGMEKDGEREPEPDKVEKLKQSHQPRQPRQLQQSRQFLQQKRERTVVEQHLEMEPQPELEQEAELESEPEVELESDDNDFLSERIEESRSRYKKRKTYDADEDVIFESGEIPRPNNPYFVTQRKTGRNELFIPAYVVEAFGPKLPETIELCDDRNRRWTAKLHIWGDGRICLSKGWKRICKWNNIKTKDTCLCEFIPATEEQEMFLKIRVVPDVALRRPGRRLRRS